MPMLEEIMKNMKWPEKGLKVFKSDFDLWNNARVDCFEEEEKISLYAEGYKEAGDMITRKIQETRSYQDTLIYPIVFLYRHYIELALKDIIYTGRKLLDETPNMPKYHDVIKLWKEAKVILRAVERTSNSQDIDAVEEILTQFSIHDPRSTSFRYPTDKGGNLSIKELTTINIRNLSEVVDALHSYFFGAKAVIGEELDFKNHQDY